MHQMGSFYTSKARCAKITLDCCILHNICLSHGLEMSEGEMHMDVSVDPFYYLLTETLKT